MRSVKPNQEQLNQLLCNEGMLCVLQTRTNIVRVELVHAHSDSD